MEFDHPEVQVDGVPEAEDKVVEGGEAKADLIVGPVAILNYQEDQEDQEETVHKAGIGTIPGPCTFSGHIHIDGFAGTITRSLFRLFSWVRKLSIQLNRSRTTRKDNNLRDREVP